MKIEMRRTTDIGTEVLLESFPQTLADLVRFRKGYRVSVLTPHGDVTRTLSTSEDYSRRISRGDFVDIYSRVKSSANIKFINDIFGHFSDASVSRVRENIRGYLDKI